MLKTIKKALLSLTAMSLLVLPALALVPVTVSAQNDIAPGLRCGAELDVNNIQDPNCNLEETDASTKLNDVIKLVINIFTLIVGVIAVIMIIVGGLKYITSGGDSGNVTSAKNTILYAIVGLIIVALAQFIVRFVLAKTTTA